MFEIEKVWAEYLNSNIDLRNYLTCAWLFIVFFAYMFLNPGQLVEAIIASPIFLGFAFMFFHMPLSIIAMVAILASPIIARRIYDKLRPKQSLK